jgi:hypothetical protein
MEMRSTRAAPYLLSLILLLASQRLGGGSCALVNPQGDEFFIEILPKQITKPVSCLDISDRW